MRLKKIPIILDFKEHFITLDLSQLSQYRNMQLIIKF